MWCSGSRRHHSERFIPRHPCAPRSAPQRPPRPRNTNRAAQIHLSGRGWPPPPPHPSPHTHLRRYAPPLRALPRRSSPPAPPAPRLPGVPMHYQPACHQPPSTSPSHAAQCIGGGVLSRLGDAQEGSYTWSSWLLRHLSLLVLTTTKEWNQWNPGQPPCLRPLHQCGIESLSREKYSPVNSTALCMIARTLNSNNPHVRDWRVS